MPPARSTGKVFTDRPASAASVTSQSGSSAASTDSEASPSNPEAVLLAQKPRRTRKKITDAQFAALEATFARNPHPSVQEREALRDAIGM